MKIRSFTHEPPVEAYVAGDAALACAKAYKLNDRFRDYYAGRTHRLRAKDIADVWRIASVSDPAEVRAKFDEGAADPVISAVATNGLTKLADFRKETELIRLRLKDHFDDQELDYDTLKPADTLLEWVRQVTV